MTCTTTARAVAVATMLLAYGVISAQTASAQLSANASADVFASVTGIDPVTATKVNDLNFGTIAAGAPATVAEVDGGRFDITGEENFPVSVTFALPSTLVAPSSATIPISFASTDGLLWAPFPTTFANFDPNIPFGTTIDGAGNLTVGIIGTVDPPLVTVTEVYTGTITLTVAY